MRWIDRNEVRKRLVLACLVAGAGFLPERAVGKEVANCTPGTELRLSAPESSQGSLLLIELKSGRPLGEVNGDWGGRRVAFWRENSKEEIQRGLIGVDLEKAPGEYELKVTAQTAGGEKIACSAMVEVKKGQFATEKLQVAKKELALYTPDLLAKLKGFVAQAEKQYAQSTTTLLIYLDAKKTYFDTLADYFGALGNLATVRTELEAAVGVPLETPNR